MRSVPVLRFVNVLLAFFGLTVYVDWSGPERLRCQRLRYRHCTSAWFSAIDASKELVHRRRDRAIADFPRPLLASRVKINGSTICGQRIPRDLVCCRKTQGCGTSADEFFVFTSHPDENGLSLPGANVLI